jgi:hypothetical protein
MDKDLFPWIGPVPLPEITAPIPLRQTSCRLPLSRG